MSSHHYVKTMDILNAVRAKIALMKVPGHEDPLFQVVKLFDTSDVDRAFAETLTSRQQRLCYIIPSRVPYTPRVDGMKTIIEKEVQFACIICDTDRKAGQEAVFGGAKNIGTLSLADVLVDELSGQDLELRFVKVVPGDGDEMTVTKEGDSDSGRKGWLQEFSVTAGRRVVPTFS